MIPKEKLEGLWTGYFFMETKEIISEINVLNCNITNYMMFTLNILQKIFFIEFWGRLRIYAMMLPSWKNKWL